MDRHTNAVVNYREFTSWTNDRMLLARENAKAIRRNPSDYESPESLAAMYDARAEAFFDAWQFVTAGSYDEIDRAQLADLLP